MRNVMQTTNDTRARERRINGEGGATLVLALAFLAVIGLMAIAVIGFGDASIRATSGYRTDRGRNYAADGALDAAINKAKADGTIGRDPALYPSDVCNPTNTNPLLELPANGPDPATVVSCQAEPGGGSGKPKDLGSTPPFALLTLGDRRSDGSLGVRNSEPGPYNGAGSAWFNACAGDRRETGVRFNTALYPFDVLAPLFYDCFESSNTGSQWKVRGNVFSNSKIVIDPSSSVPTIVAPPVVGATPGTIQARGGCFGTGFGGPTTTCTDPGWNFADGKGQDPGAPGQPDAAAYQPYSISGLPVVTMDAAWVTARVAECASAQHIVVFEPGIYTDGTAMNSVFGNASCKNATFWFTPDDHGTVDAADDTTGVFYFDFRNTSAPGYSCGNDIEFLPTPTGGLAHSWCIGGRDATYSGQRVVAGTPYNWSPNADPVTNVVAIQPAGQAGNGTGLFGFLQQTPFDNPANAKAIDGSVASHQMGPFETGGSIWMSGYPPVPRGAYADIDLEVAQAGENVDRMYAPTVQVNYGTLFTGGTCGPYTLPKPPAGGSIQTVKLSVVNPAGYADLKACLNTGDRINTAVVQYNVSRPWFQGAPYPTAKLDGARFLVTTTGGASFPHMPDPANGNPGGDCDPTKPGAQFIFGGDSRTYVANGSLEVCAGPNPSAPAEGQQIGVYGVPAPPRLVPTSVVSTNANGGVTNPDNALRIAEGPGIANADIHYSSGCWFCAVEGSMTLRFPGYTPPAGYVVTNVAMRASYDSNGTSSDPQATLIGASGGGCDNTVDYPAGNDPQGQVRDVTQCMLNGGYLNSQFDVRWTARATCGFGCNENDQLDGIELIITLAPTDPDTTLRPANGCVVNSPNFWYGASSPDCALLKTDAPFWDAVSQRRGRISIKGTLYAPSDAVEIDDGDVYYPLFSRGAIVRHFRLTGFAPHPGFNEPIFDNWVDTTPAAREVVFLACAKSSGACTLDDPTFVGRAAATFDPDTGAPTVKSWSVSRR